MGTYEDLIDPGMILAGPPKRRIVQLAVVQESDTMHSAILALCNDGTVAIIKCLDLLYNREQWQVSTLPIPQP
jgi:hypothetical protein